MTAPPKHEPVHLPRSLGVPGRLTLLVLSACVWTGCARVAPYERGTLARSDMELGDNPDLAAGEEHGLAYREGSSGGGDAKGGGCGCN